MNEKLYMYQKMKTNKPDVNGNYKILFILYCKDEGYRAFYPVVIAKSAYGNYYKELGDKVLYMPETYITPKQYKEILSDAKSSPSIKIIDTE